jgi:hypothetical protein
VVIDISVRLSTSVFGVHPHALPLSIHRVLLSLSALHLRGKKHAIPKARIGVLRCNSTLLYRNIITHLTDPSVSVFVYEDRKRITMSMSSMTSATCLPIGRCCKREQYDFAASGCTSIMAMAISKKNINLGEKLNNKLFFSLLFT